MDKRKDPLWREADEMAVDISLQVHKSHPEWDEDALIEYRREMREEIYWDMMEDRFGR